MTPFIIWECCQHQLLSTVQLQATPLRTQTQGSWMRRLFWEKKLLVTYSTLHPVNRPMCVQRIDQWPHETRVWYLKTLQASLNTSSDSNLVSVYVCSRFLLQNLLLSGGAATKTKNRRRDNEFYSHQKETVTHLKTYFSLDHKTSAVPKLSPWLKQIHVSGFNALYF